MTNRFRLCPPLLLLLCLLFLLFAPQTTQATGRSLSVSSSSPSPKEQPFKSDMNMVGAVVASLDEGQAGDFVTEKRRVPTGSNPLHNK
ncbi:uncharacterized protein J3R85_017044 [Psidium guajava]|nr:uncharacterized protein J3R85_017044 [Psidium guajava]